MAKLLIEVGPATPEVDAQLDQRSRNVETALANGESPETVVSIRFETWKTFFRVMTERRVEILEYVTEHDGVPSVRKLAQGVGRDYSAVHADVSALVANGYLHRYGNALHTLHYLDETADMADVA